MPPQESHLSDQELLLAIDGELSARDYGRVESHLTACWSCRTRRQEIESAIGEFIRIHRRNAGLKIPSADGPRALLRARLAEVEETPKGSWLKRFHPISWRLSAAILGSVCALVAAAYLGFEIWAGHRAERLLSVSTPDPGLTPGATVLISRGQVCLESNTNNKAVPVALRRRVFDEYGIHNAQPTAYEVDYLITPALGGADDIHNLWPQSKETTVWNSYVKDALEDHLRELVCGGQLELAVAQHEIASNWIQAYKKYFHTTRPLATFH